MMRILRLSAIVLGTIVLAGCSGEGQSYTEQAAAIDPALNQSPAEPPTAADPNTKLPVMPDDSNTTEPTSGEPDQSADATAQEVEKVEKVELTDEQWKSILSEEEFYVLRRSGTELPGTGRYLNKDPKEQGAFHCVGCGNRLYDAKHKFHSACGWPSFNQEVEAGAIVTITDRSLGVIRNEMRCARCDGHLGHVFEDGHLWNQETGLRHCVNGTALIFIPKDADPQAVIRAHREEYAGK